MLQSKAAYNLLLYIKYKVITNENTDKKNDTHIIRMYM